MAWDRGGNERRSRPRLLFSGMHGPRTECSMIIEGPSSRIRNILRGFDPSSSFTARQTLPGRRQIQRTPLGNCEASRMSPVKYVLLKDLKEQSTY